MQKRKRGRPRKNEATAPARRGRGRPPKKQRSEVIDVEDSGSEWGDGARRKLPVHNGLGILPNRAGNVLDAPEGGKEPGLGAERRVMTGSVEEECNLVIHTKFMKRIGR